MKGDMFHVAAIVHAKQLHSVLTYLADKRAWNVESRPVRNEIKSGGGKSYKETGQERLALVAKFLKANDGGQRPRDVKAYLAQNGHGVSNIHGILSRAVRSGLAKKTAKGYEAK